jgi:hypothetical protein
VIPIAGGFITTKFTAIYLPNYLILEIMNIFKFIESFTNDDLMPKDLEEIVFGK